MDKNTECSSSRQYENNSVKRALGIFGLFSSDKTHLTASEIAAELSVRSGTIYPTLVTLLTAGYLARDENKRYSLGMTFLERSRHILSSLDVRNIAQPRLKYLAGKLEGNTHLAVLYEEDVLYLHREEGQPSVNLTEIVGLRVSTHCTALGKVLLAHLEEEVLVEILPQLKMTQVTPNTIVTEQALLRELSKIRAAGYGLDNEEFHIGSTCIAAPVKNYTGHVLAAISVSLATTRLNLLGMSSIIADVVQTAEAISADLGFGTVELERNG